MFLNETHGAANSGGFPLASEHRLDNNDSIPPLPVICMSRIALLAPLLLAAPTFAALKPAESGKVTFKAIDNQADVAERYRLGPTEFAFELKPKRELTVSGIEIYELTFPSPVKTKYPENNTVYAEYYVPAGKGPFPGVILLDILDGSQIVSKSLATVFATHGIASLCMQMPYYGPRRPAGGKVRLLSAGPDSRGPRTHDGRDSPDGARQPLRRPRGSNRGRRSTRRSLASTARASAASWRR